MAGKKPKRGAASAARRCALLLASCSACGVVVDAFTARSLLSRRHHPGCDVLALVHDNGRGIRNDSTALTMVGFPPPMGGPDRGPPGGPMGGGPPPPMGGPGGPPGGGGSYSADNPPGGQFSGNSPGSGGEQRRGLGAIASGVSTPMDKYGTDRPPRGGGYDERYQRGPNPRFDERRWAGPSGDATRGRDGYNEPGPRPDPTGPRPRSGVPGGTGGGGRPNNLRYEEADYGEYVTNLRSSIGRGAGGDGGDGGPPRDVRELEDEVDRLRKENAMLKRSCQDLMNNFNELSNRLFDVDESLKKVAKVFPSEDEMESLEWLLRR